VTIDLVIPGGIEMASFGEETLIMVLPINIRHPTSMMTMLPITDLARAKAKEEVASLEAGAMVMSQTRPSISFDIVCLT